MSGKTDADNVMIPIIVFQAVIRLSSDDDKMKMLPKLKVTYRGSVIASMSSDEKKLEALSKYYADDVIAIKSMSDEAKKKMLDSLPNSERIWSNCNHFKTVLSLSSAKDRLKYLTMHVYPKNTPEMKKLLNWISEGEPEINLEDGAVQVKQPETIETKTSEEENEEGQSQSELVKDTSGEKQTEAAEIDTIDNPNIEANGEREATERPTEQTQDEKIKTESMQEAEEVIVPEQREPDTKQEVLTDLSTEKLTEMSNMLDNEIADIEVKMYGEREALINRILERRKTLEKKKKELEELELKKQSREGKTTDDSPEL